MSVESVRPSADERSDTTASAEQLALQLLEEEDTAFIEALRAAGLLHALDADELLRVANDLDEDGDNAESRQVEILELYYDAAGDAGASEKRRRKDRFFLQQVGAPATAAGLVERLASLTPELSAVELERIGGDEGPLVLRCGDDFSSVLDDYEDDEDGEGGNVEVPMVTVRGLVRAINVLLERNGVRERLVALTGDREREVYVALGLAEAIQLHQAGLLEDEDVESVMSLAAW